MLDEFAGWQLVLSGLDNLVCSGVGKLKMAKVKESFETYKNWLNEKLHEKNAVTDVIEKVEKATGIKIERLYLAYGKS